MDQGRRNAERKAVGLLVKLKHTSVGSFIQEYAVNISPGGMFIRSREPQPVGTPVRFEVRIADGQRMLKGSAVVRWTRPAEDVTGPAGMGIQFTELDDASQALVDRMLQHKSDLSAAAPTAPRAPSSAAKLPSVAPIVPPMASVAPRASSVHTIPSVAPRASSVHAIPSVAPRASSVHTIPSVAPALTPAPKPIPTAARPPAPVPPPPPPRPSSAVDISLDDLLAFTPAPAPEPDPFDLGPDDEYSPSKGPTDFNLADLSAAATPGPPSPAPVAARPVPAPVVPPPPPSAAMQRGSAVELELDTSEDDEPLEFARPVAGHSQRPVARKPAPAPTPAPIPRPAPPSRPTVSTPVIAPAAARPSALPPEPKTSPGQVRTVFLTPPTGDIEGKGPVIGVDLGTTNSCVAVMVNNKPTVLRSREGYNTIPSVVSLSSQAKLLVSHRARSQVLLRPEQTIYGAKRLVGRPFDSAVVNQVRERFHYEIMPDARGRAAVRMGEHVLSLEEVQGIILRECKELAEQHLGQKVERAVVTVPAYYSEPQREAVRRAGWMAGLKVERILNEPTSAALAYGLNREMAKRVLVYDLGGGTFDATVLRIDKNVFEVLATGGDIFLGGMDFDNKLVDLLLERFLKQEKVPFQGDRVALSRVTDAAERAKVALSESNTYEVHIPMLMMDDAGRPRDLHVTLTRAEMEAACMPMVLRTLDVVGDVLLDAKMRVGDVDDILLVGGQSRMPLVREKLKEMFGRAPHAGVNTDEAVALGAALYSSAVDRVSSVVLIDVLPMTIGVAMPGGGFTRVIERNTPLPAQRSFAISTTRDNEEVMELSVFQGEDTHISANEYLGTVRLEGLPKGPKGSVRVAITLRLDSECVLHVNAQEYSTRKEMKATLATRYSPEELRQRLGVARDAAQAAEERRGQDLKERSGRFWGFLKKVVGKG